MRRNVTLKDIAIETGFSVNTVSRVLRNKGEISEATRETILQIAEEMGHVHNMRASSLRSGVTFTIAVILGDVSNPHFAIMMSEIEKHAREKGYTTFLLNTEEEEGLELAAIQTALKQSVDGIILCPVQRSSKNVEYLQKAGVPFVLIGRHFEDVETDYVVCNDEQGGYLATKRLLDAGHRDILLLNGPGYVSSAAERKAGYLRAHQEAGILPRRKLMKEVPVTTSGMPTLMDGLMEKKVPFTAIFAFSDIIAWNVWNDLQNRGLSVPADVSLIGFDYISSRLILPIQLTSISSHKHRMSTTAAEILLRHIQSQKSKGPREKEQVVVNTTLVEGKSVARPRC